MPADSQIDRRKLTSQNAKVSWQPCSTGIARASTRCAAEESGSTAFSLAIGQQDGVVLGVSPAVEDAVPSADIAGDATTPSFALSEGWIDNADRGRAEQPVGAEVAGQKGGG